MKLCTRPRYLLLAFVLISVAFVAGAPPKNNQNRRRVKTARVEEGQATALDEQQTREKHRITTKIHSHLVELEGRSEERRIETFRDIFALDRRFRELGGSYLRGSLETRIGRYISGSRDEAALHRAYQEALRGEPNYQARADAVAHEMDDCQRLAGQHTAGSGKGCGTVALANVKKELQQKRKAMYTEEAILRRYARKGIGGKDRVQLAESRVTTYKAEIEQLEKAEAGLTWRDPRRRKEAIQARKRAKRRKKLTHSSSTTQTPPEPDEKGLEVGQSHENPFFESSVHGGAPLEKAGSGESSAGGRGEPLPSIDGILRHTFSSMSSSEGRF